MGSKKLSYPLARRSDQVDTIHGVDVADPYRWMETECPDLTSWLDVQSDLLRTFMSTSRNSEVIAQMITAAYDDVATSLPEWHGGRCFYEAFTGLQNQSVLYVQMGKGQKPQLLVDPNLWTNDGSIEIAEWSVSSDGKTLAYNLHYDGKTASNWHLLDVDTGLLLPDDVEADPVWTADSQGFMYSDWESCVVTRGNKSESEWHPRIKYHRLGTDRSNDVVCAKLNEFTYLRIVRTDNARFLLMSEMQYTTSGPMRFWVQDVADKESEPFTLFGDQFTMSRFIGSTGNTFWFRTHIDASKGRLVAIDLTDATISTAPRVIEVIPESDQVISEAIVVGEHLVVHYLKDVFSALKVFDNSGQLVHEVRLPFKGTVFAIEKGRDLETATFSLSTVTVPYRFYEVNVRTGKVTKTGSRKTNLKSADYVTKQVFCTSKDGTRVPMMIAHRKGIKLDGTNPTLMHGYGGFRKVQQPNYLAMRSSWLQLGGIVVVANVRGGGEYGEDWHTAGTKLTKQNTFDDFIACAEHLIALGYTSPAKLAAYGGSNGGLLAGVCATQRPDLFGAAIADVGVHDMVRYHTFGGSSVWGEDYGTADDPDEFAALYAYSSVHNVKPGTEYCAMMISTSENDQVVEPAHSYKLAAAMQSAQSGSAPIFLQVQKQEGHSGAPTDGIRSQLTTWWTFLCAVLDFQPTTSV